MIDLPDEIQLQVLQLLSLEDLARCRRVCQSLKAGTESILSHLQHIEIHASRKSADLLQPTSAFLFKEKRNTRCIAAIDDDKMDNFLEFVVKTCSALSSLDAIYSQASITAILPLAPRLEYFSLNRILMDDETKLTADYIYNNFPNLRAYDLGPYSRRDLCSVQLFKNYFNRSSEQLIQFTSTCRDVHPGNSCFFPLDNFPPSIKAINAGFGQHASRFPLDDMRPNLRQQIELLKLHSIMKDDLNESYLPNLRYLYLHEVVKNLKQLSSFLMQSPRLMWFEIRSVINEKNGLAVRHLIENCHFLEYFAIRSNDQRFQHENDKDVDVELEDVCEDLTFTAGSRLNYLALNLSIPLSLKNAVSSELKTLILKGSFASGIEFCFPNLLVFKLNLVGRGQYVASVFRSLHNSTRLEVLHVLNSSRSWDAEVDSDFVPEMVSLLSLTRSIKEVHSSIQRVAFTSVPLNNYVLHLGPLTEIQSFEWYGSNCHIKFILPPDLTCIAIKLNGVNLFRGVSSKPSYSFRNVSTELSYEDMGGFTGQLEILASGLEFIEQINQVVKSCPQLSSLKIRIFHDISSLKFIVDYVLQNTAVQQIHLIFNRKLHMSFMKTLLACLESIPGRPFSIVIDSASDKVGQDSEWFKLISSLSRANIIDKFTHTVSDGMFRLDDNKSLLFIELPDLSFLTSRDQVSSADDEVDSSA